MTTQYRYRLVPETSVPAATRALGQEALELASNLEGIGKIQLFWFLPARAGDEVLRESERSLAGWTQRGEIYIAADLPDKEVWRTVGHECSHIQTAVNGFGTMINRSRPATEKEISAAHEQQAEKVAEWFTRFHYPNRRGR